MAVLSAQHNLPELPEADWWNRFRWGMGEKADSIELLQFPADSARVGDFAEGVAFGESGETRWALRGSGRWSVVLLDDTGARLEGDWVTVKPVGEVEPILLWGPEARIPERPVYPGLEGATRVQAIVRRYEFEEPMWTLVNGFGAEGAERRSVTRLVRLEAV